MVNLNDFIPDYPLQIDPEIQEKISHHLEFFYLQSDNTIEKTRSGLFKHQQIIFQYLLQYNKVFNINETGTGKTLIIISLAEFFKRNPSFGIKQIVVLEPGSSVAADFKEQIVKFNNYYNDFSANTNNEAARKSILTKEIKKFYKIYGYKEFANIISRKNLDEIKDEYSDTLFFLDEVHKMRNEDGNEKEDEDSERKYKLIWKVLHSTERIKTVIATATPFINDSNDFVPLANLLLDKDKQLPLNVDYSLITTKQLEPFLRGMFSYVRNLDTGVKINENGEILQKNKYDIYYNEEVDFPLLPEVKEIRDDDIVTVSPPVKYNFPKNTIKIESSSKVIKIEMSEYQASIYREYLIKTKGDRGLATQDVTITNGVYLKKEGKKYGSGGAKGCFTTAGTEQKKGISRIEYVPEYRRLLVGDGKEKTILNNIYTVSCKYHFLIKNELHFSKQKKIGKAFAYIERVNDTGARYLGKLLELVGFKNYFGNGIEYRAGEPFINTNILKKSKRYAILSADCNFQDAIKDLYNSKENINGEYLQIVIGSRVARDGINMNNTLRGYIIAPPWHHAGMHQALSRFLRADSHTSLLEEGDVVVDIYKLCAVFPENYNLKSIDEHIYVTAELKDIYSKLQTYKFKRIAFDGLLNYKNNLCSGKDYSQNCDYMRREYPLFPNEKVELKEELIKKNTFRLYFAQEMIDYYTEEIKKNISDSILDFSTLKQKLNLNDFIFYSSLEKIVKENSYILDENNLKKYIEIRGESIYLSYIQSGKKEDEEVIPYINEDIILYDDEVWLSGDVNKDVTFILEIIESIQNFEEDEKKYIFDLLAPLSQVELYQLIEYIVENGFFDTFKIFTRNIFNFYVFTIPEQPKKIELAKKLLYDKEYSGRGRKAEKGSFMRLKESFKKYDKIGIENEFKSSLEEEKEDLEEVNKVTFHYFPESIKGGKNYGFIDLFKKRDRKIRVLENNKFRDATPEEQDVYNWYIEKELNEIFTELAQKGNTKIFGITTLRDKKFRIMNLHKNSKGIECKTMKLTDLEKISQKLFNKNYKDLDKRHLCKHIEDELSKKGKLLFIL